MLGLWLAVLTISIQIQALPLIYKACSLNSIYGACSVALGTHGRFLGWKSLSHGAPSIVYQLEAQLIHIFERDDRELGHWLDWCLDNLEANIDGQVDPDPLFAECARLFASDSISHIPSADQSEE